MDQIVVKLTLPAQIIAQVEDTVHIIPVYVNTDGKIFFKFINFK